MDSSNNESRKEPFIQIAKSKQMSILFDRNPPEIMNGIHLDLNVIDAVIADVKLDLLNRLRLSTDDATSNSIGIMIEKVSRLQGSGSIVEKCGLAFSRGRYVFPEDINRMAENALSRNLKTSKTYATVCQTVCNYVCSCVCEGDPQSCQQFCEDVCHEICSVED